ncbi:MAG: AAA family ATPase, partial [Chloroflexota bacterium]
KTLAEQMFGDTKALIQLDMSEYMEKFNVSRLVGSPPGYVGYEEGGQLTEAVRRRPYSVVLFDEIEKAHPDVFNTLLQVLDDGRLTDGHGRTVNFRNTVVIMTSNIGSQFLNGEEYDPDGAMSALRSSFRPEFLNRVDEIIIFHNLSMEDLTQIVEIQADRLRRMLADRQIALELSEPARTHVAQHGYDPAYGARPIKRTLQRLVADPLALAILEGQFAAGDTVQVDVNGAGLKFEKSSSVVEDEFVNA